MKKNKQIISIILVLMMMLSVLVITPITAAAETSGDFEYRSLINGIEISKYLGSASSVTIPNKIKGEPVTQIGLSAFSSNNSIKSVVIPDGVTTISGNAFWSCEKLQSVTIPDTVESIGYQAFISCKSLKSIKLPKNLYGIDYRAFEDCFSLESVTFSGKTTYIGEQAFSGCSSLKKVTLSNSMEEIESYAFSFCDNLTTINIPKSVSTIGNDVFFETYLTDVYYAGTQSDWNKIDIGSSNDWVKEATIHFSDGTFINPPKPAKISKTKASLNAGGTVTLEVVKGKVNAWTSSKKSVATVSDGKVTALRKGEAVITATLNTGKKLTCKVTVKTSPKLSKKSITVKKGKTANVKITGKAKTVNNSYTKTKNAKVVSKKTAGTIKVKGLKKGNTTLKIKVNGVALKLKVKVK